MKCSTSDSFCQLNFEVFSSGRSRNDDVNQRTRGFEFESPRWKNQQQSLILVGWKLWYINQRTEFERVQGKYLKNRDVAALREYEKWTNRL